MEEFVEYLSLIPDGEQFQTFSPQSASTRRVLKGRIAKCVQSGRVSNAEVSQAPLVKAKLSMVEVKALRAEFCQNYPGELLASSTMPSLSFLSILKEAIDGNSLAWIPWKSRTSEADKQAFLEHRRPRNERQLLRSLLSDGETALHDQPEAVINHQLSPEVVVTRFQGLLSTALAMLCQAHLIVLKRFHAKFLELALLKPRHQHLRAPSLMEILDADRVAWTAVVELLADSKWSLNDVLNEVAFCRQVFHTSSAPRPTPLQGPRPDQPKRKPDLPKPIPKKPKPEPKTPGEGKPTSPAGKNPKWNDAWLKKLNIGKGICIRFHLGKCKSGQSCRYAHQCPVAKSNGEAIVRFSKAYMSIQFVRF